MNKSRNVAPLELSDDEVKSLITETLLKAQNVFPKMKIEDLEVGARRPAGSEGVLSAWRISTNLGNFDISNNLRLVRIAPEPEARLKKKGSLPEVVQSLYSAWCSDWSTFSMDFDKKKDAGGWVHGRQVQTSEEICIFPNVCSFRFYDEGDLETFSRSDLVYTRTSAVRVSVDAATTAIGKVAKKNKLEFLEAPALIARLEGEEVKACYVSRGTNAKGYSAIVILDADSGDVLRADG